MDGPFSEDYPFSAFAALAYSGFLPDLLPCLPPGATLSPHSRLMPDKLGKIPGQRLDDGTWVGFSQWHQHVATEKELQVWATWPDVGVCINTRRMAAYDVDVTDTNLANWIEAKLLERLGTAPCRIGQAPKRLLPYRVEAPIAKVQLAFTLNGAAHAVEVLGDGQHFVAEGIHAKTGKPYTWPRGNLVLCGYDRLTLVKLDQITTVLNEIEQEVLQRGGCIVARATAKLKHEKPGRKSRPGFCPDLPCNIARVITYLTSERPAIAGANGEPHTFVVVNKCMDLGTERQKTLELMMEHWAGRCDPPWEVDELAEKVEHAYDYRENEIGCDAVLPLEEAFADAVAIADAHLDPLRDKDAEWGEPLPVFDDDDAEDIPFPSGALPTVLEDFAHDEAQRKGVEIGTVVLPALIACAAAIHHGEFQIQPTNDTSWRQRAVLWGLLSGGPSSMKTPIMSAAMAPLEEIQKQWFHQDKGLHGLHKLAVEEWQAEHARKLEEMRYVGKQNADRVYGDQPMPVAPEKRRLLVKNATVEALANVLAENSGRGVLVYRNELAGWISSFDIYRDGNIGHDRSHYLEGWDCAPQIIDRVSKKDAVRIENWYVNMLGSIQPERLKPIAKHLSMDGLLQRFLPVVAGTPSVGEDREPGSAVDDYHALVRRLTELRVASEPGKGVLPIRLSQEAREHWRQVDQYRRDEVTLYSGHEAYCEHLGKWGNQFARLLLVQHAVESVAATPRESAPKLSAVVSDATAERAARLATAFLIPNARRFYKSVFVPSTQWADTEWIASFILTRGSQMTVLRERDIYNNHHQLMGKDKARDRQDAVLPLEHRGWLRPTKFKPGRGDVEWAINPLVHARFAARAETERKRKAMLKAHHEEAVLRRRAEKARQT